MAGKLILALLLSGVAAAGLAQPLTQTPEGVQLNEDPNAVASGATLLRNYESYPASPGDEQQDRDSNRAIVARFFALPIGDERAELYAPDGVKQIPAMGIQWEGLEAQHRNNDQNTELFFGWTWNNVQLWDTQNPSVFWVEVDGHTAPGATMPSSGHYLVQVVVKDRKIALLREFKTPVLLAQPLVQTPEGVRLNDDPDGVVRGSTLLREYESYPASAGDAAQDRACNRKIVERFLASPVGADNAELYAADGVKEIPTMGTQWLGLEAHRQNNEQNALLFSGWTWIDFQIWETQDPSVFWVEADGHTGPDAVMPGSGHYIMQFVVRDGKVELFREFQIPVVVMDL